jgi:hypothetical protein
MRSAKFIILLLAFGLLGCPFYGYKYPHGKLPDVPVNLEDFNSEYDDYNATAPILGKVIPFCFSTNRHSQGGEFNIRYTPMNVEFSKTSGELHVSNDYGFWGSYKEAYYALLDAVKKVNSTSNELGPNVLYRRYEVFADADLVMLVASDEGGDFDIQFTYMQDSLDFSDPQPVSFLNSDADDLYPSFDSAFSQIFFCSDREDGVFHIYSTGVDNSDDSIVGVLSDAKAHEVKKVEVLCSEFDDKCPYIFENTLVFASDRPGGYGGFDLYYSLFNGVEWGEPVNFGPVINSTLDEYRPILFEEEVDDDRDMMVFSSNRPGGEGGFDLYYVGVME